MRKGFAFPQADSVLVLSRFEATPRIEKKEIGEGHPGKAKPFRTSGGRAAYQL
jgi:hypothetical protein